MPSNLIILAGRPYTGKSTVAAVLAAQGCGVVELDDINRDRGFDIAQGVPVAEWSETRRLAERRVRDLLAEGSDPVVVVWASPTRQDREHWRRYGAEHQLTSHMVWLECSPEEMVRRRAEAPDSRHRLDEAVIARLEHRLQRPSDEEDALALLTDASTPDELAARILAWFEARRPR